MGKIGEEGREEGELHRDTVAAKGTRRKKGGGLKKEGRKEGAEMLGKAATASQRTERGG